MFGSVLLGTSIGFGGEKILIYLKTLLDHLPLLVPKLGAGGDSRQSGAQSRGALPLAPSSAPQASLLSHPGCLLFSQRDNIEHHIQLSLLPFSSP